MRRLRSHNFSTDPLPVFSQVCIDSFWEPTHFSASFQSQTLHIKIHMNNFIHTNLNKKQSYWLTNLTSVKKKKESCYWLCKVNSFWHGWHFQIGWYFQFAMLILLFWIQIIALLSVIYTLLGWMGICRFEINLSFLTLCETIILL